MKYDEILALLALLNLTLNDIDTSDASMSEKKVKNSLTLLQNSKKQYFPDRTVYYITDGSNFNILTIFTNGTTEYNNQRVTFEEISVKIKALPRSDLTANVSNDIQHTTQLGGGKYQFYWKGKWYITDEKHIWPFDDETSKLMNKTFFGINEDTTANKKSIGNLSNKVSLQNPTTQLQIPFELFSQSLLIASRNTDPQKNVYKWGEYYVSFSDMLAMLRLSNFNALNSMQLGSEWGTINWDNVYNRLKQSEIKMFADRYEYNITNDRNEVTPMIIYFNGSSIWNNKKLDFEESLTDLQNLNNNTVFSSTTIKSSYVSNDLSFTSFVKSILKQQTDSKTKYTSYKFHNINMKYDEILALLALLNLTLNDIDTSGASMSEKKIENSLTLLQNSKKQYFPDRTVYYITDGSNFNILTIFTNGTTEYNNRRVTFEDILIKVKALPQSDLTVNVSNDIQHTIRLGGGKYQFYWKGKWYITDEKHIWPFDNETSKIMNETFFGINEDTTANKESIGKLLNKVMLQSPETQLQMPFELFSQSVLNSRRYTQPSVVYRWGNNYINYGDLLAMLRISNFSTYYNKPSGYQWGQTNWQYIYQKIKEAPKSTAEEGQEYNVTDFDGTKYILIVFKNGTSLWKNKTVDISEALASVEEINNKTEFSESVINSPYISNNQPFEIFVTDVAKRSNSYALYYSYVWKNYTFTRDEILAVNRMIMQEYFRNTHAIPNKGVLKLSFSNLVVPLLKAKRDHFLNKVVFNINGGSENHPLTVYHNGTTDYYDWELTLSDTIENLEKSRNVTGLAFKEDVESVTALSLVSKEKPVEDEIERQHNYDWREWMYENSIGVKYPVSIGSGFVQFVLKSTTYITDGSHIWNFYGYEKNTELERHLKHVARTMNQTFADDPNLNTTNIQELVNVKVSSGSFDLIFPGILMPFEIMVQQILFFSQKAHERDRYHLLVRIPYIYGKRIMRSSDILICVMLVIFDQSNQRRMGAVSWSKTRKINWEWLIEEVKVNTSSEINPTDTKLGITYRFNNGVFTKYPNCVINTNFTISCGDEIIHAKELYNQVKAANKELDTSVIVVKSIFGNSTQVSFNYFGMQIVNYRLQNRIHTQYAWNGNTFTWYRFLAFLRLSDSFKEGARDDAFWQNIINIISKTKEENFIDGFKLETEKKTLTVYMNETTDFQEEVINDYNEYSKYFLHT